jgi:hypothetical protein
MGAKVKLGDITAIWDDELGWKSENEVFQHVLNLNHKQNVMPDGANPWRAGVAVELALQLFPELKVVSIEKAPEFDEDVIY